MTLLVATGVITVAAFTTMLRTEAATRLGRIPLLVLQIARQRLPTHLRDEQFEEWHSALIDEIELPTAGLPIAGLIRGLRFAVPLVFTARRHDAAKSRQSRWSRYNSYSGQLGDRLGLRVLDRGGNRLIAHTLDNAVRRHLWGALSAASALMLFHRGNAAVALYAGFVVGVAVVALPLGLLDWHEERTFATRRPTIVRLAVMEQCRHLTAIQAGTVAINIMHPSVWVVPTYALVMLLTVLTLVVEARAWRPCAALELGAAIQMFVEVEKCYPLPPLVWALVLRGHE